MAALLLPRAAGTAGPARPLSSLLRLTGSLIGRRRPLPLWLRPISAPSTGWRYGSSLTTLGPVDTAIAPAAPVVDAAEVIMQHHHHHPSSSSSRRHRQAGRRRRRGGAASPSDLKSQREASIALNRAMKRISESTSRPSKRRVDDLLALWVRSRADFDSINCATLVSRLGALVRGRAEVRGVVEDGRFLAMLRDVSMRLAERPEDFCPRSLASLAHGLARLRHTDRAIFRSIDDEGTRLAALGNPQQCANSLWACATLNLRAPRLFAAVAGEAERLAREGKPQELSSIVWSYAKLGMPAPALFRAVAGESERLARDGSSWALSNAAWAYAKMKMPGDDLLSHQQQHRHEQGSQEDHRQATMSGNGNDNGNGNGNGNVHGGMDNSSDLTTGQRQVFRAIATQAERIAATGSPQALATLAWAYAHVGPCGGGGGGGGSRSTNNNSTTIDSTTTSTASSASGGGASALADEEHAVRELFAAIGRQGQRLAAEASTQGLAMTVGAFARLDLDGRDLFAAVAGEADRIAASGTTQGIASTVWAFAKMRVPAPQLFEAVALQAERIAAEGTAHGLARIVWAFAKQDVRSPRLFEAVAGQSERIVAQGSAQDLAATAWALSKMGVAVPRDLQDATAARSGKWWTAIAKSGAVGRVVVVGDGQGGQGGPGGQGEGDRGPAFAAEGPAAHVVRAPQLAAASPSSVVFNNQPWSPSQANQASQASQADQVGPPAAGSRGAPIVVVDSFALNEQMLRLFPRSGPSLTEAQTARVPARLLDLWEQHGEHFNAVNYATMVTLLGKWWHENALSLSSSSSSSLSPSLSLPSPRWPQPVMAADSWSDSTAVTESHYGGHHRQDHHRHEHGHLHEEWMGPAAVAGGDAHQHQQQKPEERGEAEVEVERCQAFLAEVTRRIEEQPGSFNARCLSTIARQAARFRGLAPPALYAAIASEADRLAVEASVETLSITALGFAHARAAETQFAEALASQARRIATQGSPQEIANIAWAAATLDVGKQGGPIFDAIAAHPGQLAARGSCHALSKLLWSFGHVGVRAPTLFGAVAAQGPRLVKSGRTNDLARLVAACNKTGLSQAAGRPLVAAVTDHEALLKANCGPYDAARLTDALCAFHARAGEPDVDEPMASDGVQARRRRSEGPWQTRDHSAGARFKKK